MGKFYESTTEFMHKWEQIANVLWKRYPNPYSQHVLSEDTIFREIRGDSLYTRRLLTKTNRVPKWGERFIMNNVTPIVEESYVNPKKQKIVTYTRNIGHKRVMEVVEKVIYKPSICNAPSTTVHRLVWIESHIYGFRRAIERFGLKRYKSNCQKTIKGLEFVLGSGAESATNREKHSERSQARKIILSVEQVCSKFYSTMFK